jgi:predicted nucleic acid-binding protein
VRQVVYLDTSILGKIAHPRMSPEVYAWLGRIESAEIELRIPEISDYEVRRNFLCEGMDESLQRLNALKDIFVYEPITTQVMLQAAEFWAEARKAGRPTASRKALDGDAILAAQAKQCCDARCEVVVATEDVGDLTRYVCAKHWKDICPARDCQNA